VDTNADGIRSTVDPASVRGEDLNVVVLGDSFAYGFKLPPELAPPQQLEAQARAALPGRKINVFNFGWPSSSPLLSLRLLRDIGSHYKPDVVILMVDLTDYHDEIKYRRMLARRGIWALSSYTPVILFRLALAAHPFPWLYESVFGVPQDRFFVMHEPLAESRALLAPMLESIDQLDTYARETLGAKFLVVQGVRAFQYSDRESPQNWERQRYLPLGPYVRAPFEFLESEMAKRGIPYLSLLPAFEASSEFPLYLADDPHWNQAGSGLAARAMFGFCQAHGWFE
jgi:hypothetical protein